MMQGTSPSSGVDPWDLVETNEADEDEDECTGIAILATLQDRHSAHNETHIETLVSLVLVRDLCSVILLW